MTYTADHILASGVKDWAFQRVPEPRAYMVLGSGDLAVLSYNKMYQIQGWARWTFSGDAKSVAVLDTGRSGCVCRGRKRRHEVSGNVRL